MGLNVILNLMNRGGLIVKNNSHFNLLDWLYMDDAAAFLSIGGVGGEGWGGRHWHKQT